MRNILVVIGVLGALAGACSSSTETSSSSSSSSGSSGTSVDSGTSGSDDSGTSGGLPTSLTTSFHLQCERCHGPEGNGMLPTYPKLPGDAVPVAVFISTVRSGKGGLMPAFVASQISDDDLQTNFTWLTEVRQ